MKKFLVLFLAVITSIVCSFSFTACAPQETQKVMNLSLNPQVEFVLDADDKVVSVNALNEEGNLIVSAEVFVGKTAQEAAELFVEVSKETGFIVSGRVNTGENELKISFSGSEAKATALYNSVKAQVEEYLTEENISATITKATSITKAKLESLVAECAPYLDEAKIQAMKYDELMQELVKSRQETAEFYSQELKNAYYQAKAFAMEQAELQAIKVQEGISGISGILFDAAFSTYTSAVEMLENTRMMALVNEDSPYQIALRAFREAKTNYLNYRNYVANLEQNELTTQISTQLASFQSVVDSAETALLQAGQTANATIDSAKAQLQSAYDSVVGLIQGYSSKVSQYATQIATKQAEAQTTFFNNFETSYANAISAAQANWNDMKLNLQQGYNAE